MKYLEEQLDKQGAVIRKYLLDWLDEATVKEIDEKIITEPDFLDGILLVEQEILEDLTAGRLKGEEKARAERIYQSPGNRNKLDFAAALYKVGDKLHHSERSMPSKTEFLPSVEPLLQKTFLDWFNWQRLTLVTSGFILAVGISLGVWYLLPGKRAAFERELARLNQPEANRINNDNLRGINLPADSVRTAAVMPKIQIFGIDEVIRFQLSVVDNISDSYRATFLDEKGNELFSVSGIKPQEKQNGATYVYLLVPSDFLHPGDFQISLQGQSTTGTLTKGGNYTFRVTQ